MWFLKYACGAYNSTVIVLSFVNKVVQVKPKKFIRSSYPVQGLYIFRPNFIFHAIGESGKE